MPALSRSAAIDAPAEGVFAYVDDIRNLARHMSERGFIPMTGSRLALALAARADWPRFGSKPVWLLLLLLAAGCTVDSEWLNVNVRGSWAYAPLMPTVPLLGTGLSPVLQWIGIPTAALGFAIGRAPWNYEQQPA